MSTWGVGDNHDSDEVRNLKDQLRTKGASHATLQGELLKREGELKEVCEQWNVALAKLAKDADRVVQLEAELKRRSEDLVNERVNRANAEAAFTAADERLKQSQQEASSLQATIDILSSRADSTLAGQSKLQQDNASLSSRVRALESELQNRAKAEEAALRQSQPSSAKHRRQPSDTGFRTAALEKEVTELRTKSTQQASELDRISQNLARARNDLVRVQNEKTASERRLQKQLEEAQAALEDQEEDLRLARDARGGADVAAREAELLERLEEEERRVATLENELARSSGSRKRDFAMLEDELNRMTGLLEEANAKVTFTEGKITELNRQQEATVRDFKRLQQERDRLSDHVHTSETRINELELRLSTSSQGSSLGQSVDQTTADTMERLLTAIERLRGERDSLRRDLEFLNVEHQFSVQSLEQKLTVATSTTPVTSTFNTADLSALEGHIQAFQDQVDHSTRVATVLAIVAQRTDVLREHQSTSIQTLQARLSVASERLLQAEHLLQEREGQLSSSTGSLDAAQSQVDGLRATVQRLEDDLTKERHCHAETGSALADAEAQLNAVSEALSEAEGARDALALEKTHLESDLAAAREELDDAEAHHAEQLASLSAAGQAGHGVYAALRAQVRELEERILRRTEQIGVHQHDIKRLELNMKLQEDRIAEMTQDLEVYQNEKVAMLEDCRTTREERDDAMQRCDQLEEAMEVVEEHRERELEAMVHVAFSAVASKRDTTIRSRFVLTAGREERLLLEERVRALQDEQASLTSQLEALTQERDRLVHTIDANLSSSQAQLDQASSASRAAEQARTAVESHVSALQTELESKDKELACVQRQLSVVQASHADRQSLDAGVFAQEKEALESQLDDARASCDKFQTLHKETAEELQRVEQDLKRAEDELACQLASTEAQSSTEVQLREEIAQVKEQHAAEIASIEGKLEAISAELDVVSGARREAESALEHTCSELNRTKELLEMRLAEAGDTMESAERLEAELERLKSVHSEEIRNLRAELDTATCQLQDIVKRKEELEALHSQAIQESQDLAETLSKAQQRAEDLENVLAQLRVSQAEERQNLQTRLDKTEQALVSAQADANAQTRDAMDELARTVEELQGRVTALTREADEYRAELDDEKAAHVRTHESTIADLQETVARRNEAEAALAEAERELPELRAQLENMEGLLHDAEEEKLSLQHQTTTLEAEVQRAKSLQRFLQSQVSDGENRVTALEEELAELRTKATTLDKLAQTTQANLTMEKIQHDQTVASLRRELNTLRAQPSAEDEIADLREKNAEYEELLRAKCLEIEDNDDKFIEMLKEKKKLNNKIDSLSRKVQNLQTKLAVLNDAAAKPTETPAPPPVAAPAPRPPTVFSPSGLAPAPTIFSAPAASYSASRQRVVTAPATHAPNAASIPPVPIPTFRPKTPESRSRLVSGPSSSTSRPKTPESRMPVFKARTPERHRTPTATPSLPESSSSSSSLIGVKRRAPDDFDDCASVPPQTFTADSAPLGPAADGEAPPPQPTTPRLRKAFQNMRTGFTPVRHQNGHRAGSASPRRATTGTSVPAPLPPTIADVTNSPRASSHSEGTKVAAAKKGWLGKLKSAPAQQSRGGGGGYASRQPVFDPAGARTRFP